MPWSGIFKAALTVGGVVCGSALALWGLGGILAKVRPTTPEEEKENAKPKVLGIMLNRWMTPEEEQEAARRSNK